MRPADTSAVPAVKAPAELTLCAFTRPLNEPPPEAAVIPAETCKLVAVSAPPTVTAPAVLKLPSAAELAVRDPEVVKALAAARPLICADVAVRAPPRM